MVLSARGAARRRTRTKQPSDRLLWMDEEAAPLLPQRHAKLEHGSGGTCVAPSDAVTDGGSSVGGVDGDDQSHGCDNRTELRVWMAIAFPACVSLLARLSMQLTDVVFLGMARIADPLSLPSAPATVAHHVHVSGRSSTLLRRGALLPSRFCVYVCLCTRMCVCACAGHISTTALAAASIAGVWQAITSSFLWMAFGGAVTTLCAQAHGAGNSRLAAQWLAVALATTTAVSGVVAALWLVTGPVLRLGGYKHRVADLAHEFCVYSIIRIVPMNCFVMVNNYLQVWCYAGPCLVVPYRVASRRVASRRGLSCRAVACRVALWPVVSSLSFSLAACPSDPLPPSLPPSLPFPFRQPPSIALGVSPAVPVCVLSHTHTQVRAVSPFFCVSSCISLSQPFRLPLVSQPRSWSLLAEHGYRASGHVRQRFCGSSKHRAEPVSHPWLAHRRLELVGSGLQRLAARHQPVIVGAVPVPMPLCRSRCAGYVETRVFEEGDHAGPGTL
jgi:hypothetical protein